MITLLEQQLRFGLAAVVKRYIYHSPTRMLGIGTIDMRIDTIDIDIDTYYIYHE